MGRRRILVTALLVSGALIAACSGKPAAPEVQPVHVPQVAVPEPAGPQGAGAQSPAPQAPSAGAGIQAPEPTAPANPEFGVVAPGKIWYKDGQGVHREIEVP